MQLDELIPAYSPSPGEILATEYGSIWKLTTASRSRAKAFRRSYYGKLPSIVVTRPWRLPDQLPHSAPTME